VTPQAVPAAATKERGRGRDSICWQQKGRQNGVGKRRGEEWGRIIVRKDKGRGGTRVKGTRKEVDF